MIPQRRSQRAHTSHTLDTLAEYVEALYAEKAYDTSQLRLDRSANPLTTRPRKYWSQADEDGIIEQILGRLGSRIGERVFVEIGVGDGLECNTIALMSRGWRGAWISGQPISFTPATGGRLVFHETFLTLENLLPVFSAAIGEVGEHPAALVSVDIDGNDYYVCEALLAAGVSPAVWVVEYNAAFPADAQWVMPYQPDFVWDGSDYYGVAIFSLERLFAEYGYFPVACSAQGANVFFVSEQHRDLFHDVPSDLDALYQPPTYQLRHRWGHPTSPHTIAHITEG